MESVSRDLRPGPFTARILSRRWLSPTTFELTLERPAGFDFQPGQRVRLWSGPNEREYSIAAAPGDPDVVLCIRRVGSGGVSAWLSTAGIGTELARQRAARLFYLQAVAATGHLRRHRHGSSTVRVHGESRDKGVHAAPRG